VGFLEPLIGETRLPYFLIPLISTTVLPCSLDKQVVFHSIRESVCFPWGLSSRPNLSYLSFCLDGPFVIASPSGNTFAGIHSSHVCFFFPSPLQVSDFVSDQRQADVLIACLSQDGPFLCIRHTPLGWSHSDFRAGIISLATLIGEGQSRLALCFFPVYLRYDYCLLLGPRHGV